MRKLDNNFVGHKKILNQRIFVLCSEMLSEKHSVLKFQKCRICTLFQNYIFGRKIQLSSFADFQTVWSELIILQNRIFRYSSPFLFIPDETYYGNFVASHPLPHFGSCAHQGIEKIQPSMWVLFSYFFWCVYSSSFIQNFLLKSLESRNDQAK